MQGERCIPIKKKLLEYMSKWYSDFQFVGSSSQFYAFRRENSDGIYDHIIIQREFYEGTISLIITEAAACYNKSWKGIPWFTMGHSTDIGVLITGKNYYDANIGWRRCGNNAEELNGLFDEIRKDIDTYVIDYFTKCHEKINSDKFLVITNSYMQDQFEVLSESDIHAIKEYLANVSKAYSEYTKACKKSGEKETIEYYDIIPLHPIVEHWVTDIQELLDYAHLSNNMRIQIIRKTTVLFRDNYNFYNLR